MIPRTEPSWQRESQPSWQQQLQNAITEPAELLNALALPTSLLAGAQAADRLFKLRVPHAFVARMEKGRVDDPLLRQVLPLREELISTDGYGLDPVGEQGNRPGLIQKYHGRVLLMVNGHCAINCRYCFRRHFPYTENRLSREQWLNTLDSVRADTSIEEIILSGGDPLASSDRQLHWLIQEINRIPHIKRLRVHTRLPVVIPDRITQDCLAWMQGHDMDMVVVLHINHPQEIDETLRERLLSLKQAGITLLNQSVLLKGVNDSLDTLSQLSKDLLQAGVLPYYLHLLDRVAGAAHFDIAETQAIDIHHQLQAQLPGYLVPKLVREIAGERSKTLVA